MTEADARDMLDKVLESTGQNAVKNESARVFSERWLKAQIVGLAETSILSYKLAVRLFLEHLGPMADKPFGQYALSRSRRSKRRELRRD